MVNAGGILVFDGVSDVGEFAVFKDEEVVFFSEELKLGYQVGVKVDYDINVCLIEFGQANSYQYWLILNRSMGTNINLENTNMGPQQVGKFQKFGFGCDIGGN